MSEKDQHTFFLEYIIFQRFTSIYFTRFQRQPTSKSFLLFLGSAVYTPEDGDNWMLAKLNLQITDLGYAQIVEHLGKVNIITSFGKMIATHRI